MFRLAACASVLLAVLFASGSRVDDAFEDLRARLRSRDKWNRAAAVEALAREGTPAAWELVVEALADPKGEVADGAQLLLSGLPVEERRQLLGDGGLRSKEALVRARACEVLGRWQQAPAPRDLEHGLEDSDPEVRRMAAWSVERLARGGAAGFEELRVLAGRLSRHARSDRDPLVRVRCLAALSALEPESARATLGECWRDRDALVRGGAAARALELLEPGAALERLATLAADASGSVRRAAAEALGELGTRGAAGCLVQRLAVESEERLVLRLVELLRRLSGLRHGRDPRPWRDWSGGLEEGWKGARARPQEDEPASRTVATLAGLPIVSKRVAILIDLSGSIWSVRPDGRTRKQVIDVKLREALESLSPDTRFNLVPYNGEPIPWKDGLVEATPRRVREAASWFEARKESGSGNFWDAAMLALTDPEVDTLLVLFDGAPTGGTRHRLELIVPLFLELDEARRVALDVVLVDGTTRLTRIWGELAARTGGRLVAASL